MYKSIEKKVTEADKIIKEKQIKLLETSIKRRKNLLSNENYLNKAPAKIVEAERKALSIEENKLKELTK